MKKVCTLIAMTFVYKLELGMCSTENSHITINY